MSRVAATLVVAGVLASLSPVAASAASKPKVISGPDVANYQHPGGAAINWKKVAGAGASFAIVKATEGSDYTNPYFAADYAGAAKAGLVHGSYHFARPELPIASTAKEQAAYFAKAVGAVDTAATLPPALDFEVTGGLSQPQLIRWGQAFLLDLRRDTGRTPMLYTYPSFWSDTLADPSAFSRYPIWMASYSSTAPVGATMWQFTSSASIRGIQGDVDDSRFVASKSWPWATISNGRVATPWKPAAPGVPTGVTAVSDDGTSATINWQTPDAGTAPIESYVVTAKPGGAHKTVGPGHLNATVTKLTPGTSYSFRVSATNKIGTGTQSSASNPVVPTWQTVLTPGAQTPVTPGSPAQIEATLTNSDGGPMAGQSVDLQRLRGSGSAAHWRTVASGTTDRSGDVSFSRKPYHDASWQLAYAGVPGYAATVAELSTPVQPRVGILLSTSKAVVGQKITVTATLLPAEPGARVTREVKIDGTWKAKAEQAATTDPSVFSMRPRAAGVIPIRITVGPADERDGATSEKVKLHVS